MTVWEHLAQWSANQEPTSERLGHSTIAITLDTYSRMVEGMDADAAATVAEQIFRRAEP